MDKTKLLETMWDKLAPLREDIARSYPDIKTVVAVQFRGYNEQSVNSPEKPNTIDLWVNLDNNKTELDEELMKRHEKLLNAVWTNLLNELGDKLDRVMIGPVGGVVWAPGIYPASTDINDNSMPRYQPLHKAIKE